MTVTRSRAVAESVRTTGRAAGRRLVREAFARAHGMPDRATVDRLTDEALHEFGRAFIEGVATELRRRVQP